MLHEETVERTTLELLTALVHDPELANFNLARGTALALYIGHRKSIDLDLFTPESFDATELGEYLDGKEYPQIMTDFRGREKNGTFSESDALSG